MTQRENDALAQLGRDAWIEYIFSFHKPSEEDIAAQDAIRGAAKELARAIFDNCRHGSDRIAALRKVREAVMTANAAIALKGIG